MPFPCHTSMKISDGVGSGLEELTIAPGAEVFHLVEIRLMPDDNYQLEIREGLDLMSLEAWEAAVDNIPDELFINNPSQRKGRSRTSCARYSLK